MAVLATKKAFRSLFYGYRIYFCS